MTNIHLDVFIWTVLLGVISQLIVPLVTTELASPRQRTLVLAVIGVATSFITLGISSAGVNVQNFVLTYYGTLLTAITSYKGITKPLGANQAIAAKTSAFGVGPSA